MVKKKKEKEKKKSIAEQVFEWLDKYPYIIWALKNELINYSSLARKIQNELRVKNFDAVLIAIRRYKEEIKKVEEEKITSLLQESSLEIRTAVNVYIVKEIERKMLDKLPHFHLIEGSEAVILITDEKLKIDCIKEYKNLVEVRIKSPERIEKTKGFVAFVYTKIAERGINIIETYSAYTDTIFIIEKKDLAPIVDVLEKIGIS